MSVLQPSKGIMPFGLAAVIVANSRKDVACPTLHRGWAQGARLLHAGRVYGNETTMPEGG